MKGHRLAGWGIGLVAVLGGVIPDGSAQAPSVGVASKVIRVEPGDAVARLVRKAPEGTTFVFKPGVYREVSIRPKTAQRFVGENGAILSGARLLDAWEAERGVWRAQGTWLDDAGEGAGEGECEPDAPLCREPQDLFVDGTLWPRVGSRADVSAGTWFQDGTGVVIAENPKGRLIELSTTAFAFQPTANDVEIRNLTIEKYAPGAQRGAISARMTTGWRILDTVARLNHGAGLDLGDRTRVRGGAYNHNGQMGLRAEFGQAEIEDVEIAHNNTAGYLWGWEAGGTKFLEMTGLTVRGACVHNNVGPGLWTDANNVNVVYENNLVFRNWGDGIKHEISYNAVIRNNVVLYNGFGMHRWLWGAQILIQNSANTLVTGNEVDTLPEGGNGISIVYQDRRGGGGRWVSANNRVVDNRLVLRGRARAGLGADFDRQWFFRDAGNHFDGNTYVVAPGHDRFWGWRGDFRPFAYVQRHGQEQMGSVKTGSSPALREVTCADVPRE